MDGPGSPYQNNRLITLVVSTLYNKPTRHQTGAAECLLHGADSPPIKTPDIPQTASEESQSPYSMPKHSFVAAADPAALLHAFLGHALRTCVPDDYKAL